MLPQRPADAVHPPRRPAGTRQAPAPAARAPGRLLRRRLRQLLRPGAGRGGRLGPAPRRGQRLRPVAAAELGHGLAGRRRHRPRARPGPGESPHPRQRGPRRLHGRLLRADRRADAPRGIRQADRGPRRRAGGRRTPWTWASTCSGWPAAGSSRPRTNRSAHRVGYHQPCHLRALDVGTPGLDLLREHTRAGRGIHRSRLLGHGRDLWPGPAIGSGVRSAPAAGF